MKRPEQHITDSKGDALFRSVFTEWTITRSEKDYGWDYIVEVFKDGTSTGLLFNAQLKSSLHTAYSSDKTFISQALEHNSADYLARQLRQPTFLFHADVSQNRIFWSPIQLDASVSAALEKRETSTLTVRIPTSNALPENFSRFLDHLGRSHSVIVSRILGNTSHVHFADSIREQPVERIKDVASDLHQKAFHLDLQTAHKTFQAGNLAESKRLIKDVLASSSASTEIRFNATLQLGDMEWIEIIRSAQPQRRAAEARLATAQQLRHIARGGPKHLRVYSAIERKAAELGILVQQHVGLSMVWRVQSTNGHDPMLRALAAFKINQNFVAAGRKYAQAIRLAEASANSSFRSIIPDPITHIAREAGILAKLLRNSGLEDAAQQYRASALELFKFSVLVGSENRNIHEVYRAAVGALDLEDSKDGEIYRWCRSIVDGWPKENEYRATGEEILRRFLLRKDGAKFQDDIKTNRRQIHQNILTSYGVDPTAQPWAGYVDLAIKDADPTRVLKECVHKEVIVAPSILNLVALEHAGTKSIHCGLHNVDKSGNSLDSINILFTENYCSRCVDKMPRPAGWKYSSDDE